MARKTMDLGGAASVRPPSRERATTATQQAVADPRLRISLRLAPEIVKQLNDIKNERRTNHEPQSRYSLDALATEAFLAFIEKEGKA